MITCVDHPQSLRSIIILLFVYFTFFGNDQIGNCLLILLYVYILKFKIFACLILV